ncbi:MAG: AAA family ATPase [Hyphomicrobium sp.]|jgi:putative ATP-dependent endonuclease of OLD family
MKIANIQLWGFRCFGAAVPLPTDQHPAAPIKIDFDDGITALIGRNGSGKSALLTALQRLFGETRDERSIRQEDFFVAPGQTLEAQAQRSLIIEAVVIFPELETGSKEAEKTVPPGFRHMIVDSVGKTPFARIRLEATWQQSGALDGTIEENIYWILTDQAVPFGPPEDLSLKRRMSQADRASIIVRYIPASRDVTTLTKLTVKSLGRSLMQSVVWQNKAKISTLLKEAGAALDAEESLLQINKAINTCWSALNTADTQTSARLSILPPDFQQIVRAASVNLDPSPIGRAMAIEDLSDGQRSLFHFALVKSPLEFKLSLEVEVSKGNNPPFSQEFMRAPALTLFAFEEPENHLAPYFLSRLMTELQTLTGGQRVQGLVTSHSPAIVGRLAPEALRHMRLRTETGISYGSKLKLPDERDEAAKFVREAVRAHPEIYFARHAIFGEGASEEIVLPRIADALDVPVDRSFVAIVPIGGRYIEHFWRLVTQLGIPHTTLMDLDLGRSSGDLAQFKAVAKAVSDLNPPADPVLATDLANAQTLVRNAWGAPWDTAKIEPWVKFFEQFGVFFSDPLDLDMAMLAAFPDAYRKLLPGASGPQNPGDATRQAEAAAVVLGSSGFGSAPYLGSTLMPHFPWYSYLFLGKRGKPAVHLAALSELTDAQIKASCPPVLQRLISRVRDQLERGGA